ncbi:PREDICTED: nucleoporin NUP159-like [Nicotiana attenuata]|uniref:nucleoporin NUP159-like n=1 Tax=Nicotiana attenuata TaxID=49451 RepID=UPI000905714A|nr:PREDICTED: nucleoporin NUP159-like [Nicotiana attenuata]
MRPPSREEEASPPAPKLAKDKKRKRVSTSETPKSKKSKARKSKKDTAVLPADLVQRLREKEEENEDAGFELVARTKRITEAPKAAEPVRVEEIQPRTEEISEEGPSKVPESSEDEDASRRNEQSMGAAERVRYQSRRETLEEIHARGFNLAIEIENAKELEAKAKALLSSNDDDSRSVSGFRWRRRSSRGKLGT